VKEIFTKFLKVGGCKTLFFHLMIFFLNKNTDFCWEIAKIFKSWGGAPPPPPPPQISTIWAKAKKKKVAKMLRIFYMEIFPFVRINQ